MPVYEINRLSFIYPGAAQLALEGIDLQISPGEFVGITGPTGAGKSTLLKCMNGIIPHFQRGYLQGEVLLQEQSIANRSIAEVAHSVGTVMDDPDAQIVSMEVEQELSFVLENRGIPVDKMQPMIKQALMKTGLSHMLNANPNTMSGGQKQRLAIAASLVMQPQVLLLDEPTSELDPRGAEEIYEVLKQLNIEGITIVVVEQNVELLSRYASRMMILDQGKIAVQGSPREVFSQADTLRGLGVQLPQIIDLCIRLGAGADNLPLTEEEGLLFIKERLAGAAI